VKRKETLPAAPQSFQLIKESESDSSFISKSLEVESQEEESGCKQREMRGFEQLTSLAR
jgi:hypothetical protein